MKYCYLARQLLYKCCPVLFLLLKLKAFLLKFLCIISHCILTKFMYRFELIINFIILCFLFVSGLYLALNTHLTMWFLFVVICFLKKLRLQLLLYLLVAFYKQELKKRLSSVLVFYIFCNFLYSFNDLSYIIQRHMVPYLSCLCVKIKELSLTCFKTLFCVKIPSMDCLHIWIVHYKICQVNLYQDSMATNKH